MSAAIDGWYVMVGIDVECLVCIKGLKCDDSILECERESRYKGDPRLRKVIDAAKALDSEWPEWTDEPTRQMLLKACGCDADADYTFIELHIN